MSIVSQEIDLRPKKHAHPTYRSARLVQQTGGTNATLSTSSTTEVIFEIPSKCWNMAESILAFDINLPAAGGGLNNVVHTMGAPWCNRIQLRSKGGSYVCDLQQAHVYARCIAGPSKKMADFKESSIQTAGAATAATVANHADSFVFPSGAHRYRVPLENAVEVDANRGPVLPSQPLDVAWDGTNTGILLENQATYGGNACRLLDGNAVAADVSNYEPQYFTVGKANTIDILSYKIPLKEFVGTALADPRDIYFPEVMELVISFNSIPQFAFTSTDGSAANLGSEGAVASATLSNLYLYQQLEVDPEICNDLIASVQRGSARTIPFVHSYREAYTSQATYFRQLHFGSAHGKSLLRIIHCNKDATESGDTAMQIDNNSEADGDGAEVISFYTSMDNLRLQEYDVVSGSSGLDYMLMKNQLRGSVISTRNIYNHNRVWCDNWSGFSLPESMEGDIVDSGLPLQGVQRLWSLNQTNNGSVSGVNYVFAVCQKTLSFSGGQILVV